MNTNWNLEEVKREVERLSKKETLTDKEQRFVNNYLDAINLEQKRKGVQKEMSKLEKELLEELELLEAKPNPSNEDRKIIQRIKNSLEVE